MGSELVGDSLTHKTTDNGEGQAPSPYPYTELFYKLMPTYLAMGMSADEYWHGDAELCKAYRDLAQIRRDQENEKMWLQGLYIYDAILCAAPRLNSIKPKAPEKYPAKPIELEPMFKPTKKIDAAAKRNPNLSFVKAWAERVNKKHEHNS